MGAPFIEAAEGHRALEIGDLQSLIVQRVQMRAIFSDSDFFTARNFVFDDGHVLVGKGGSRRFGSGIKGTPHRRREAFLVRLAGGTPHDRRQENGNGCGQDEKFRPASLTWLPCERAVAINHGNKLSSQHGRGLSA